MPRGAHFSHSLGCLCLSWAPLSHPSILELLRKISFYVNNSAIGISLSLVKTMLSYDIHWTQIVYAFKSEK